MLVRAIRETFASPRLPIVLPVGALVGLLLTLVVGGPLQVVALLLVVPLAGYGVSYTRQAIVSGSASLPGFGDVLTHGRRGIGVLAATLPVALLLLIPPVLVIGLAGPEASSARQALCYGGALGAMREHAAVAAVPILLDLLSAGLNLTLRRGVSSAVGIPGMRPYTALAAVLDGVAAWPNIALLAATAVSAIVGFATTLVTAHLIGQFAVIAYADEESPRAARTRASS